MDTSKEPCNINDHGTVIDRKKGRIKCNYCEKVMSGSTRLKYHLGGVRGDVVPCEKVPGELKSMMKDWLLVKRQGKMCRETVKLFDFNLCPEMDLSSKSTECESVKIECQTSVLGKRKDVLDLVHEEAETRSATDPCSVVDEGAGTSCDLEGSSRDLFRCIGRFFYDAGIDFGACKSPYFRNMLAAAISHGEDHKFPRYEELKGWVLQEELKEVHDHVKTVKQSWERTGCSILLDTWTDEKRRSLVSVLVNCPRGTIFLKSVDVSDSIGDVDKLFLLYDGIIQDVGVNNVVQVITYDASRIMQAVGKKIMEKHRSIFWNLCAAHCISLILENIGKTCHVRKVLNKAKNFVKFIYSHKSLLTLLKIHTHGKDLLKPSKLQAMTPFLTLDAIVAEKENLENMCESSTWTTSVWASSLEGKKVAQFVEDPSFWAEAIEVLNVAIPLVCVIRLISAGDKAPMGYIYETMDQAKESIKKFFKNVESKYKHWWEIIDDIWNNQLHSPLHCAGYFLNPTLFYSSDFFPDAEVTSGLLCCIVRMVEDHGVQDLMALQIEEYRAAVGGFGKKNAVDQRRQVPPAVWWSLYGGDCPQLQRLAVRILSQTCTGSLRFRLKRSLWEKLHSRDRNSIEQQRLLDLAFVHYNLRLRDSSSDLNGECDHFLLEDVDPMSDWVAETQDMSLHNDKRMDVDAKDAASEDTSMQPSSAGLKKKKY